MPSLEELLSLAATFVYILTMFSLSTKGFSDVYSCPSCPPVYCTRTVCFQCLHGRIYQLWQSHVCVPVRGTLAVIPTEAGG